MSLIELILIAIGLSMDAFAVSVCKGLSVSKLKLKNYITIGLWFGGFQALMPTIGYFLGASFEKYITSIDHWIAFVLLLIIGGNMIKESLEKESDEEKCADCYAFKTMFVMAIATSIDALAVGVSLAFEYVNIWMAAILIGVVTYLLSIVGLKIGNIFGNRYKTIAEIIGGIVLIFIGTKILISHLMA